MRVQATKLTFSPSDLNNFLECGHLVALEFAVAHGELARPAVDNPQAELIRRKGDEHERAYLESLRAKGLRSLAASLARQLPLERVSSPLLVRACAELEREPDFAQDVCASLLANYLVHMELGSKGPCRTGPRNLVRDPLDCDHDQDGGEGRGGATGARPR